MARCGARGAGLLATPPPPLLLFSPSRPLTGLVVTAAILSRVLLSLSARLFLALPGVLVS